MYGIGQSKENKREKKRGGKNCKKEKKRRKRGGSQFLDAKTLSETPKAVSIFLQILLERRLFLMYR